MVKTKVVLQALLQVLINLVQVIINKLIAQALKQLLRMLIVIKVVNQVLLIVVRRRTTRKLLLNVQLRFKNHLKKLEMKLLLMQLSVLHKLTWVLRQVINTWLKMAYVRFKVLLIKA